MLIVLLGSFTFAEPLRRLGHQVIACGADKDADLRLAEADPDWTNINHLLKLRGLKADAVLVTDNIGKRTLPTGLWSGDVISAFYGVDAPLNKFWQFPYSKCFDLAFLDQPAEAELLAQTHSQAWWLPVGIEPSLYPGSAEPSRKGACFVGVVNDKVRPKRSALLDKISKYTTITILGGRGNQWFPPSQAAKLYRSFELVVNENLFPGLTTRPLEVMASGGALLSEAAPGAMDIYFNDLEHLVYFSPADLEEKLGLILGDSKLRKSISRQGQQAVLAGHSLQKRAETISNKLTSLSKISPSERPRATGGTALAHEGEAMLMAGLRWPQQGGLRRVLRGAGRLDKAAVNGSATPQLLAMAGLAQLALERPQVALQHLRQAAEQGGILEKISLLATLARHGRFSEVDQALSSINCDIQLHGGDKAPAGFHRCLATVLAANHRSLEPGFDLRGAPQAAWTAMEHLLEATRLEPASAGAWEELGDLLLANKAPNQAHECFARARTIQDSNELTDKESRAAIEGYLI